MTAEKRVLIFVPLARGAQANALAKEVDAPGGDRAFVAAKVWRMSDGVHVGWVCNWAMSNATFNALRSRFDVQALRDAGVRWTVLEDPDPRLCASVDDRLQALGFTLVDPSG